MPDLKLPVELSVPLILALVALLAVGGIVLVILHATDRELDLGVKPFRVGTHRRSEMDRRTEKMYLVALRRLTDLETAVASIVEADPAHVDQVMNDWLDYVCEGLATCLSAGNNAQFRVAIWTDDERDPATLKGIAWHGFNRSDPKYQALPRATTLAGWAIEHREEHYAPYLDKCVLYKPRSHPPTYKSMFVVPLGSDANPWASMTVDAPAVDGLSEERRELIRRFGSLASVGARIYLHRTARPGTTGTTGS